MAGRNHHHVWQLLQRGFGEKRGKDHHVWVYSKSKSPEKTVTRIFGSERHFYGPEGSQADTNITNYENKTQSAIQDLRKLPDNSPVDPEFASMLIAHLEVRSSFLRNDASERLQKVMSTWTDSVSSPKSLREFLLEHLSKDPKILGDLLAKEGVPKNQRAHFEELARLALENTTDHEIQEAFSGGFGLFKSFISELPSMMKEGHNKILSTGETFPIRAAMHKEKSYSLFRPTSGKFILPDTTLAFIKDKGASPFADKGDVITAIVLPIASDVAIVGKSDASSVYSLKTLNRILAGCSFKEFIAHEQSDYFKGLTQRIGKYAKLLSEQDMKEIIKSPRSIAQS